MSDIQKEIMILRTESMAKEIVIERLEKENVLLKDVLDKIIKMSNMTNGHVTTPGRIAMEGLEKAQTVGHNKGPNYLTTEY